MEPSPLCMRLLHLDMQLCLMQEKRLHACISPELQLAYTTLVPLREETEARRGKTCWGRRHYLAPQVVVSGNE